MVSISCNLCKLAMFGLIRVQIVAFSFASEMERKSFILEVWLQRISRGLTAAYLGII